MLRKFSEEFINAGRRHDLTVDQSAGEEAPAGVSGSWHIKRNVFLAVLAHAGEQCDDQAPTRHAGRRLVEATR